MKTVLLSSLICVFTSCAMPRVSSEPELSLRSQAVVELDDQDSQLATLFNAESKNTQMLVVLSPT